MLILGLLLLAGAAAIGTSGVLDNRGSGHQVSGGFDAFGQTMHGSSGQLFFWGIVVGGVAMLGLTLLLGGLRGDLRRRGTVRRNNSQRRDATQAARTSDEVTATEVERDEARSPKVRERAAKRAAEADAGSESELESADQSVVNAD